MIYICDQNSLGLELYLTVLTSKICVLHEVAITIINTLKLKNTILNDKYSKSSQRKLYACLLNFIRLLIV